LTAPGHLLPWAEIAAAVDGAAVVLGCSDDQVGELPVGWTSAERLDASADGAGSVVAIDPVDAPSLARAATAAGERPLVVVVPNVGRPTYLRALMVGRGEGLLPGRSRHSRHGLDSLLARQGRLPRAEPRGEPVVSGRPLDDLVAGVVVGAGGHDRPWLVRRYDVAATSEVAEPRVFLTVLVRTQGRRPEALADVLLCLGAQSCQDVEVLVLAHDVDPTARRRLDAQVAALPTAQRARIEVVTVTGGGRSRPLNVGAARSRGQYVAVLDDDDLVLGHWAGTFRAGAEVAPGSIQRAVAVEQDVEHVRDRVGHRASSWPRARWDTRFSLLSHIVDNHSPIHSYAYPREVFHELGLRFDESLPVLEDWDLLVRAASLVGVHDTVQVTAVYRRWPAAISSFADVAETDWPQTAWQVVAGWDRVPLLLPAGSVARLRREGIETLRRRPLRERLELRLRRARDRWSARLMRTPVGPALRWAYRRVVRPAEPPP
jgi:hypothetical protein